MVKCFFRQIQVPFLFPSRLRSKTQLVVVHTTMYTKHKERTTLCSYQLLSSSFRRSCTYVTVAVLVHFCPKNMENIVAIQSIKSVKVHEFFIFYIDSFSKCCNLKTVLFFEEKQKESQIGTNTRYFMDKILKFRTLCVRRGASRNRRARSSVLCRDQRALYAFQVVICKKSIKMSKI